MPVNNVAALYSLPSFKGHSYNLSLDNSSRYRAAGVWELNNAGLVPTQGSISVYAGDVRYALLILFRSFYGSTYQFQGNFTMFTAAPGDWLSWHDDPPQVRPVTPPEPPPRRQHG